MTSRARKMVGMCDIQKENHRPPSSAHLVPPSPCAPIPDAQKGWWDEVLADVTSRETGCNFVRKKKSVKARRSLVFPKDYGVEESCSSCDSCDEPEELLESSEDEERNGEKENADVDSIFDDIAAETFTPASSLSNGQNSGSEAQALTSGSVVVMTTAPACSNSRVQADGKQDSSSNRSYADSRNVPPAEVPLSGSIFGTSGSVTNKSHNLTGSSYGNETIDSGCTSSNPTIQEVPMIQGEAQNILGAVDVTDLNFEMDAIEEDTLQLMESLNNAGVDLTEEVLVLPLHSEENIVEKPAVRRRSSSPKARSRKRLCNPKNWRSHIAKRACDQGIAHVSLRGKVVRARAMKAGCADSCQRRCQEKFSQDVREAHFKSFWMIADHNRQYDFITRTVSKVPISRRTTDFVETRRNSTFSYGLVIGGEVKPCCKVMYLHTLDISSQWVRTAMKKLGAGGTVSPDKRGRHTNRGRAIPLALKTGVVEHISKFPTVEGHYTRETSTKLYLDEHLNIRKMYRMYKMEQEGSGKPFATLRQYQDIFNTQFNYSFFKPKKDQCDTCLIWKDKSPEDKEDAVAKSAYERHISNKERARMFKKADVEEGQASAAAIVIPGIDDSLLSRFEKRPSATHCQPLKKSICVASFDLEKVLYTPKGEASAFYYKSKLTVYNFTIFDMVSKEGFCFVWDQTLAQKGGNEIASCVWDFIKHRVFQGVVEFRFYSDNCVPQNKNSFLFSMYHLASHRFNIKIVHRYLEKGHTQMECDSMHARIESRCKNVTIYTPHQWYGIMRSAKVTRPAYVVVEMDQQHIFSFKDVAALHKMDHIPVSKVREVILDSKKHGKLSYKIEFDSPDAQLTDILPVRKGRPINWSTYVLIPAYSGKLAVKEKLLKGLLSLCDGNHIPAAYHDFYRSLTSE